MKFKYLFILFLIFVPSIVLAYPVDDSNTIFLMHFNNSYIDEGGRLTNHVNTVFDNIAVKFGSHSLNLTSDGANVSVSTTGLSISPCTIDFWMYSSDWTSQPIMMIGDSVTNGYIQYYSSKLNYDHAANLLNFGNPSINTWHHYALVDNGTYLIAYLDGNLISTHLTVGFKLIDGGSEFHIGTIPVYHQYYLRGYVDEFRISDIDRYNSLPFTPPTEEYLPFVSHLPVANITVDSTPPYHLDDNWNATDTSDCYQCTERLWNITKQIPESPVYHTNISDADITKYWPDWGTYEIIKQVRNSSGMNESITTVTILNITPDSDFTGIPLTGTRPLDVTFTDASTGNITSWNWSFGDGNLSTLQNPTNLYSQSGNFDVNLSVCNPDECNNNLQVSYIVVTDPTPTPTSTTTIPTTVPVTGTLTFPPLEYMLFSDNLEINLSVFCNEIYCKWNWTNASLTNIYVDGNIKKINYTFTYYYLQGLDISEPHTLEVHKVNETYNNISSKYKLSTVTLDFPVLWLAILGFIIFGISLKIPVFSIISMVIFSICAIMFYIYSTSILIMIISLIGIGFSLFTLLRIR